jgi:hypothetical protein
MILAACLQLMLTIAAYADVIVLNPVEPLAYLFVVIIIVSALVRGTDRLIRLFWEPYEGKKDDKYDENE